MSRGSTLGEREEGVVFVWREVEGDWKGAWG